MKFYFHRELVVGDLYGIESYNSFCVWYNSDGFVDTSSRPRQNKPMMFLGIENNKNSGASVARFLCGDQVIQLGTQHEVWYECL